MVTPERERAQKALMDYLAQQGLRKTSQREAIVAAALSTREHFTAEELHEMARRIDRSVSRATVYRTLPLLVESGLLRELDLGGGLKRYDPNFLEHPTHNHIVCLDCNRIVEFVDLNLDIVALCNAKRQGFTLQGKFIKIEARCDRLAHEGRCPNKSD
ncbi:MAG: transcriptional repressor [Chthoniobacterales bacterium]|nr:transcriptional repressor [Chthoniobacterales bacterium]MCX7713589.1 transcriptional repressor [Chthoniobacterales bacterium]